MGTEDMRRQQPNVQRMELLGRDGRARRRRARGRSRRPSSAAIRDWVTNVGDHPLRDRLGVGPAPFPAIVRDLQRVIGDEARAQMLEREGRLPDRVIACVGGGSNAIGIFVAVRRRRRASRWSASRPRARGSRPAATARR